MLCLPKKKHCSQSNLHERKAYTHLPFSGLRIYYTDHLRQHDASMLLLGSEVNFMHIIPPRQDRFTTVGRCTADCTRKVTDAQRYVKAVL